METPSDGPREKKFLWTEEETCAAISVVSNECKTFNVIKYKNIPAMTFRIKLVCCVQDTGCVHGTSATCATRAECRGAHSASTPSVRNTLRATSAWTLSEDSSAVNTTRQVLFLLIYVFGCSFELLLRVATNHEFREFCVNFTVKLCV